MRPFFAVAVLVVAHVVCASQEGPLPISRFRLESDGIGQSGAIVIEGKQNDKAQIVELKVRAFGKEYAVPPEKLKVLAGLGANGIRISYESGYEELGGRTVYIQLQLGFTSHTAESALITITESGKIEVSRRKADAATADSSPTVKAEATVVQYTPRAVHDTYDDGRCETFDAVELRLTAPRKWQGTSLRVYCTPGKTNSLLSTVGAQCSFEIEREYLAGPATDPKTGAKTTECPFEGALVNLKELRTRTPDYTEGEPGACEVHRVAMTRRAVPWGHGMVPMHRSQDNGAYERRMAQYPHPGDCKPATDIVLPGQKGLVVVFVCPECERAKRRLEKADP
jgi:hypothetical protein